MSNFSRTCSVGIRPATDCFTSAGLRARAFERYAARECRRRLRRLLLRLYRAPTFWLRRLVRELS